MDEAVIPNTSPAQWPGSLQPHFLLIQYFLLYTHEYTYNIYNKDMFCVEPISITNQTEMGRIFCIIAPAVIDLLLAVY